MPIYGLLASFLFFALAACQQAPLPEPPATATVQPSIVPAAVGLTESASPLALMSEPPASVAVTLNNSAGLWAALDSAEFEAIIVHHLPPARENGGDHWINPIVLDGIALIVHPDNPVTALTLAQAQAIFSGQVTDWAAVGGENRPITVLARERGAGIRTLFNERVLQSSRLTINARILSSTPAITAAVAADPDAIGMVMLGTVEAATTRVLIVDAIQPNVATIANQTYPLSVPVFFVNATASEPTGPTRAWLGQLQSADGQLVLGDRYGALR